MKFLNELNAKQREAVMAAEGPVMVVAGPGSGKTRVLTYRIAHLVAIGVPAWNILALTFTNKAANEMRERVLRLVGEDARSLWMGTFHSICARLLRIESAHIGFDRNFSIYDTADSLNCLKAVMHELGISTQQYTPQAIRSRISSAKNQLASPEELASRASDVFEEKTARVFAAYQQRLKASNAMDFDDLLLMPIGLFQSQPKVLARYQERFRFLLVDEYQDTNRAQYVLIKLLAARRRNICVVGDDAQSIYAFRGADIRNILDFQGDYPDARVIRLEQNYRSTGAILSAADRLIKFNAGQITKTLWTENPAGEAVTLLRCEDDRDEGARIVAAIYEESHRRKIDFKDFAIMYRTNAQSRSLEDALRRNSIPYTIVGGIEFYQRKEVKDILAYLRLLVNAADDEAFLRIVNAPNRGIGTTSLARLRRFAAAERITLLAAAARPGEIEGIGPRGREALAGFAAMIHKYANLRSEMSPGELARALVDDIGILRLLKEEGTAEALSRWENVQELLSAVSEFSAERDEPTLDLFLQEVSLVSDIDRYDAGHNAVTLMTLHSAKGLEFPVVFISGLEEGLLPFSAGVPDRQELEEERRLCYVGITRAMTKVYLSHCSRRYRFGEISFQSPSRFIQEIGELETVGIDSGLSAFAVRSERGSKPRRKGREEQFYADEMPDYESDQSIEGLRAGRLVEHEMFGRGKVVSVSGTGDRRRAVVDFASVGRKMLMVRYARLKPARGEEQ